MDGISIIIPTLNEEENIIYLIRQIDTTLRNNIIPFEIIVVDDNSTNLTQHIVKKLEYTFPVKLYIKKGKKGKTQSILEGISYATYPLIATLTPDTHYSPEKIITMLGKMKEGYDIVVTNGKQHTIWKKFEDIVWRHIFGGKFHYVDMHVGPEIKLFKKEIIERLIPSISTGKFDLTFLIRASHAGYKATRISAEVDKYTAKTSKETIFNFLQYIFHFITSFTLSQQEVIPYHQNYIDKKGQGFHYKGSAFTHFSTLTSTESAFFSLTNNQKVIIAILFVFFLGGLIGNWHLTLIITVTILTVLYFADLLFNLYLILRSFYNHSEITVNKEDFISRTHWPSYTIFCPLYKEGVVLQQFIQAIEKLDYPKEQLQVILLLEEDDKDTIKQAKSLYLPGYFSTLISPQTRPKTKPKALNYGLQYAKGDYCVVYDAEDIPDTLQLKKVVTAFEKSPCSVKCMQAKLNFYNPFQNVLTRVFTAEYSLWFELILTGLQSSHTVIPLGGTSNHFRTRELRKVKGWDSFNVTEDCDLGLRLAKEGYQTAIVNSTTLEEANSNLSNWFHQRSRWIKGYMQTYLVHIRHPHEFIQKSTIKQFFIFQLVVGGKVLSLFINPFMWLITISYFLFRPFLGSFIETFFPGPVLYMGVLCLVFGNFLYLYYYMLGCAKREQYALIKYAFLVPVYWLCMSISGWYALYKIITKPHQWAKTHHGLHLKNITDSENKDIFFPKFIPHISV